MSAPQFTPGPWVAVQNKFGEFALVRPETDQTIILLDDTEGLGDCLQYAATARLIAAAPELYEALNLFATAGNMSVFDGDVNKALAVAYDKAAAALAKARGEVA